MTAATLVLTAALANWQAEIQTTSGVPLLVAKVEYSEADHTFRLPAEVERRELFVQYLSQPTFVAQFHQMYAAMVHHRVEGQEALSGDGEWRKGEGVGRL